eukprot:15448876-Alexandrium_andersonii.AAC.1
MALLGHNLALQIGLVGGEALQGVVRAEVSRTEVVQLALAILPEAMIPQRDARPRRRTTVVLVHIRGGWRRGLASLEGGVQLKV